MTRQEAKDLIDYYRKFPKTKVFSVRPINYPLFYLLECFAKGWTIYQYNSWGFTTRNELDFEDIIEENIRGRFANWKYVALDPDVKNSVFGLVQEDLFARYVGKCLPLKTPNTSWTCIPLPKLGNTGYEYYGFTGKIGNDIKLYMIQIDLDTTNIIGKYDENLPWHYLQQTIEWKPFVGDIPWQPQDTENDMLITEVDTPPYHREILRDRFNRIREEGPRYADRD